MSTHEPPKAHPMLATELLGFQPQLLLDELMSAVNETIYESTARVEEYLNQWIDEKEQAGEDIEPLKKELEYGMHALQTLLENYADLAFDFFEAWSHRNIFVVDEELPIVAPHQRGLDLEVPLQRERDLQIEVETLRRKLDNMRRQYAKIRRCEAQAATSRKKAEALLNSISFVEPAISESERATKPLADFLAELRKLYDIPRPEPATGSNARPTAGKEAYLTWAVDRLIKESDGEKFTSRVEEEARQLTTPDDIALGTSSPPRIPGRADEDTDDSVSDSMTSQG